MALYGPKEDWGGKGAHIGSEGDQPAVFREEMVAFLRRTLGS